MADIYGNTVVAERAGMTNAAASLKAKLEEGIDESIVLLPIFIAQITNAWRSMHWARESAPPPAMDEQNTISESTVTETIRLARNLRRSDPADRAALAQRLSANLEVLMRQPTRGQGR